MVSAGRTYFLNGSPYDMGLAMGRSLGPKLESNIRAYTLRRTRTSGHPSGDPRAATAWLQALPARFREELTGLADGARVPLQRVADWVYLEPSLSACTAAIVPIDGNAWVARNNDTHAPDMWGYITVRETAHRIPWMSLCLEGDVFTPTGINRDTLWLHYHYLPSVDEAAGSTPGLPPYAFIVEALETCRTLLDLETLLDNVPRTDAMMLFAVEGTSGRFAIYECDRRTHDRRDPGSGWLAGTNHRCVGSRAPAEADMSPGGSVARLQRVSELLERLGPAQHHAHTASKLMGVLADDRVEARDDEVATAYSCIACPSSKETWYTFGGWPAASRGRWAEVRWPWR